MTKLLSALLAGVFAATLSASVFAADPAPAADAAPTAKAAPMKHKHMHKAHKAHKAEKTEAAPAAPEAAK